MPALTVATLPSPGMAMRLTSVTLSSAYRPEPATVLSAAGEPTKFTVRASPSTPLASWNMPPLGLVTVVRGRVVKSAVMAMYSDCPLMAARA